MDMNASIEDIFNRSMLRFDEFGERLNASYNRALSAISGSTTSDDSSMTEAIPVPQLLMPLPNNYEGMNMDEFMENWMNEEQDMLGHTIIDQSLSTQHDTSEHTISLVYHNASGMKSKIHELNDCLHLTKFDIFLFAETWFDESIDSVNITAGTNYTLYRRDRSAYGGGVAIASHNSVHVMKNIKWPKFIYLH